MTTYSVETCNQLENCFYELNLHRPKRYSRYDPGRKLNYNINSIDNKYQISAELIIKKFVGGGFAGQVYQVEIAGLTGQTENFPELRKGNIYALKILIPPSGLSKFFRNLIYRLGFQGPFQPQVNPAAARVGAIWQKLIRIAAGEHFKNEDCIVDIYGLFIDYDLGSCGEISEWIEGRTWWLEVDDQINFISRWKKNNLIKKYSGSTEYRSKFKFMKDLVKLLHQLGAPEFARQYEWATLKSQPNCLKRNSSADTPEKGLVAVDFRAGLALLPYLPMSPGDYKLIIKGILRGSLVQFDRGNISRLKKYIEENLSPSEELDDLVESLIENEEIYRNSILDLTHNHFRIFFSKKLWSNILRSSRISWKIRKLIDENTDRKLAGSSLLTFFLNVIISIPILGRFLVKFLGMKQWRDHYISIFTRISYFNKALKGLMFEKLIKWYRSERIDKETVEKISTSVFKLICHTLLSIFPARLHRFLTNREYFKYKLYRIFVRPLKLYFDPDLREEWLREMVVEGKSKHMLSNEDAEIILDRIDEPFIQKYLKSLAVHICTIPITQIVSVFIAILYVLTHPEMPRTQAWGIGLGIIALFQIIPISPGSLVRGLYVVYLVLRERNFKDYNIAVYLGFFKYIGYLAFPIQMTYRYPAMARFMAGHWATEAVHIIPVFGERGALLEHWVFNLFYNWPLTIRRQMTDRFKIREALQARIWHIPIILIATCIIYYFIDQYWISNFDQLPGIRTIWYLAMMIPFIAGSFITRGAGGMTFKKRVGFSLITGLLIAVIYSYMSYQSGFQEGLIVEALWRCFILGFFTIIGCFFTEISLGENS